MDSQEKRDNLIINSTINLSLFNKIIWFYDDIPLLFYTMLSKSTFQAHYNHSIKIKMIIIIVVVVVIVI